MLDHLFSSSWMMMTIFFVVLIISSIIAYGTNFFKNKIFNWIYKAIFIVLPFSPVILGIFIPINYGFSYEIPVMKIIDDKLCLLDKKEVGDDSGDWEEYRLHILNATTGEKLSRQFYKDIYDIGISHGDTLLLYSFWDFKLVDINSNKLIREINKEYLKNRFSELSLGIENWNYSRNKGEASHELTISITTKTAKTYYYEPFSDKLLTSELRQNLQPLSYGFSNDAVFWRDIKNKQERIVSLEYSKESNKIKHLKFESVAIANYSEISKAEFLEAEILEVFPDQKLFIMVSYETTDKLNFVLDAIGFDGNRKWNIKQSELGLTDKYTKEPQLNTAIQYHENLIFNCGGFIVSLNANSGKINWKQRV